MIVLREGRFGIGCMPITDSRWSDLQSIGHVRRPSREEHWVGGVSVKVRQGQALLERRVLAGSEAEILLRIHVERPQELRAIILQRWLWDE